MQYFVSNVPVVSRSGYVSEQLYKHIRNRFIRNNKNLKELAKALDITEMLLTQKYLPMTIET